MTEPERSHGQHHQSNKHVASVFFRALGSNARASSGELAGGLRDGLMRVAVLAGVYVLAVGGGGLLGWLIAGGVGALLGVGAGLLAASLVALVVV